MSLSFYMTDGMTKRINCRCCLDPLFFDMSDQCNQPVCFLSNAEIQELVLTLIQRTFILTTKCLYK